MGNLDVGYGSSTEEKLEEIINLMKAKGYDPVAQLTGYIKANQEDCITRHGNAMEKIKAIDMEVIRKYIETHTEAK